MNRKLSFDLSIVLATYFGHQRSNLNVVQEFVTVPLHFAGGQRDGEHERRTELAVDNVLRIPFLWSWCAHQQHTRVRQSVDYTRYFMRPQVMFGTNGQSRVQACMTVPAGWVSVRARRHQFVDRAEILRHPLRYWRWSIRPQKTVPAFNGLAGA